MYREGSRQRPPQKGVVGGQSVGPADHGSEALLLPIVGDRWEGACCGFGGVGTAG